jgi:hypothetical protein
MTKETYCENMGLLQTVFSAISEEKFKTYWFTLKDFEDGQMKTATERLVKTFRPTSTVPFPCPSDFIEAAGISAKTTAQEMMGLIQQAIYSVGSYRSVDFGSPAVHAAIERFGGWDKICNWNKNDWNINEGRFLKTLESAIEFNSNGPAYLKGTFEAHNQNQTYADMKCIIKNQAGEIMVISGRHPNSKQDRLIGSSISANEAVDNLVTAFSMDLSASH